MVKDMKDFIKGFLIFMALCAITIGIAYFGSMWGKERNETIYNNGICTDCGGHYDFISVAKNRHTTYYYYQCDNCEKIIELRH